MSFRIPTLEEARRKREGQTVTVASPSSSRSPALSGGGGSAKRGASSGSRATSTAASASTSAPAGSAAAGATGRPRQQNEVRGANVVGSAATAGAGAGGIPLRHHGRPAAATVLNPYAKKRRQASSTSAGGSQPPSSVAPNWTSNGSNRARIPQTKAAMGHTHHYGKRAATSSPSLPEPPPPVVDVGPSATFSQAFGSLEDTRQYETEVETLRRTNADAGPSSAHEREKERAQQRTVDAEAAAAASSSAAAGASAVDDARANQATLQPHVLHVSTRQRGNGVLRHVRNVPLAYSNIVPDYILGANRCALFLSLRYHGIHPNYVHRRIKELGRDFDLRVLLCLVDVEDNASALLVLNKLCVANDLTLILSWSEEEAARYLETFKALESKDASSIQRREKDTYAERVADVLSAVRSVNKTDAAQLLSQFGSLKNLASAPMDELSLCPGIGEKKVRRLFDAFHKPFSSAAAARKRREASERKEAEEEKESAEAAALALEEEEEEEKDGIVV